MWTYRDKNGYDLLGFLDERYAEKDDDDQELDEEIEGANKESLK